jgi:hypothetical protein
VRVAFMPDGASWSAVGRDAVLKASNPNEPSMNLGVDLGGREGMPSALHEVGHVLGLEHEHQNPQAGIVWDDEAVYAYCAKEPNKWDRPRTFDNILRKIDATGHDGSPWDPESIMEYEFPPGLVLSPKPYDEQGIKPPGTISAADRAWVRRTYPPLDDAALLEPLKSATLAATAGDQSDFALEPPASREYTFGTFGDLDSVLVLFEEVDGHPRYVKGDDDSGEDRNAQFTAKLFQGRRYILRVRVNWMGVSGGGSVMYW